MFPFAGCRAQRKELPGVVPSNESQRHKGTMEGPGVGMAGRGGMAPGERRMP